MAYSSSDWVVITICVVAPILAALAAYGVKIGWGLGDVSLSDFVTLKKKPVELPYILPGFLFAAVGSIVITKPGAYAAGPNGAGLLGLCMYAIWSGLAVIIIALLGKWIRGAVDGAESISDFVSARFGPLAELYIALLVLFNTSVLLIAELTNIRELFIDFVQTKGWSIVLIVGLTALLYVAIGGLKSVLSVHPFHAIIVALCAIMIASYVGSRFRGKIPSDLSSSQRGYNPTGYSSILLQPIVLVSVAFFNEGLWQKCWAAKDDKTLTLSATLAAVLVFGFSFASGYMALAAYWTGLVPVPEDGSRVNPNIYFFHVFEIIPRRAVVRNWIGVVTMLAAATFSQGYVSALQNGITNTVTAYLLRTQPPHTAKFVTFCFNIPIIAVACTGYADFPKVFRCAALLSSTTIFPVVAGTLLLMVELYTGDMMLYSSLLSILGVSLFGVYNGYDKNKAVRTIKEGLTNCWWTTSYNWKFFLVALMSSVLAVVVCIVLGLLLGMLNIKYLTYLSPTANYQRLVSRFAGAKPAAGGSGGGGGNGKQKGGKK